MIPFGVKTVTGIRRTEGTPDKLGVPARVETTFDIPGCSFQPLAKPKEDLGNVDLTQSAWKLFAPAGTGLTATDAVRIDGLVYEIVGDPHEWPDPVTGVTDHTEIWLRRANG
jgi:hypothetical protein